MLLHFKFSFIFQFFCPDGEFSAMGTLVFSTPEESAKSLFHADRGDFS